MKRHWRVPIGFSLAAAGAWMLWPTLGTLAKPPDTAEIVRLCGPLRALPVPFLWLAWRHARRGNDLQMAAAIGRWLPWLLPERDDLFRAFALELAFDVAAQTSDVEQKARLLADALRLLEQGAELHPGALEIARAAVLILRDRCMPGGSPDLDPIRLQVRAAFRRYTGRDPLELAQAWLQRARQAGKADPDLDWDLAILSQEVGLQQLVAGDRGRAAILFARAAEVLRERIPHRSARLAALSQTLAAGAALDSSLRAWLIADPVLGRQPEIWGR
jgi:hypothetical protein